MKYFGRPGNEARSQKGHARVCRSLSFVLGAMVIYLNAGLWARPLLHTVKTASRGVNDSLVSSPIRAGQLAATRSIFNVVYFDKF